MEELSQMMSHHLTVFSGNPCEYILSVINLLIFNSDIYLSDYFLKSSLLSDLIDNYCQQKIVR